MSFSTGREASSSLALDSRQPCRQLKFSEIQLATQNFDESLVIGRGGFGKVYKGTITNGVSFRVAAIKRLDSTSNQGVAEFWTEVEMLSKLRHCDLVSLIGYCNDGQEMILVYEYMPHGSLEDHLHKRLIPLSWVRRLKICIGAARGLDYLHTGSGVKHGVIHRDVKSSNILLHDTWAAKIADFGLSKIGPTNQPSTYVNTLIKGTFGYLDPDYFATGRLTRKSDVYAFGVVLLEVLCGKRAVDRSLDEEQWGLAGWAQDSIEEGRLKQIVDPNIKGIISPKCLKDFARLADQCLRSYPKQRPTMAEVVISLESILALQEKTNNTLNSAGLTIFGRKAPMFHFPSSVENSVRDGSLKSLKLYFDTVGGEDRLFCQFDIKILSVATENFSEANKVFRSQIGLMYKGRLGNGQQIAILQTYDEINHHELINEVSLLVKLDQENLAQLFGYCIDRTIVFLVYAFTPLANLGSLILDPRKRTLLDWEKRYKIILGVARALVYLHNHAPIQVIHSDVHLGNIYVDENYDPKLSGFVYARCLAINETDCINVNVIRGTSGYMAPEYAFYGRLSTKADVFNLGVLILQTVSGRTHDFFYEARENVVLHGLTKWWERIPSVMIDPTLDGDPSLMSRFIHIGLLCVQDNAGDRPTMVEVVSLLVASSFTALPIPKVSTWMIQEDLYRINWSLDYDSTAVEEFISELAPR